MKNKTLCPARRGISLDRATNKKNNKGQSLIDVIFSVGILVLMLTGVVTLVITTAKLKTMKLERKKMTELSQLLIEQKIREVKENPSSFWGVVNNGSIPNNDADVINSNFSGYKYDIDYKECTDLKKCIVVFTIKSKQTNSDLSVERVFLKDGI